MKTLSAVRRSARNLWSGGRGLILIAIASGWCLSAGMRMVYPLLLPNVRAAYGFNLTTAGLLLTVLWIAYAAGQLPGGILADRIGEGNILIVSSSLAAVSLGLILLVGSGLGLFVATVFLGFGAALYGVARFTTLSGIYDESLGTAVGLVSAAGDVGHSVLPFFAGIVTAVTVWQYGFGFMIPLFILVAVGIWISVPGRMSRAENALEQLSAESIEYVYASLRQRPIVAALTVQILGTSIWQAFTGFYPTYLIEVKGLSTSIASALFGIFFGLGVVIKPLSGFAYDRIGIRRSLSTVIGMSAVGLVALPFVEGFWPLLAVTMLVSAMLGRGTITLSYVTMRLSEDMQNTGLGVIRTSYFMIGAASPVLFGAAADRGVFDEAFMVLAAMALLTLLVVMQFPD